MMPTNWDDVPESTPIPGFHGRVQHSGSMSFVLWRIDAGAPLPQHRHIHEQVVIMLEGTFELTVDGRTRTCRAGDVAAIAPDTPHSGRALTDCRILDVFSPVREDYRDGLTAGIIRGGT